MNSRVSKCLILTLLMCPLATVAQTLPPELGAGYKAGFACSAAFHAGRALDQIIKDELGGDEARLPDLPDPIVDYRTRSVTCAYADDAPPRVAVFIENWGTVLLPPGATVEDAKKLPHRVIKPPRLESDASQLPWPRGDRASDGSLPARQDAKKIAAVIGTAFEGDTFKPCKTLGVVVVYKDQIVGERYREGWGPYKQYRTWSTAKSITNALVGIAVKEGLLKVGQRAPIPEWEDNDDPRRAITIEHLLHMSSGLKSQGSATSEAYWGGIDTAADASASPLEEKPGTRWTYSNYDTLLLMRSIKEVLGSDEAYMIFPRRELFNKIGMRHTFPETDPQGNFILSSQVYTTPRDLARFGMLYLHDGVWEGDRILPEGWVEYTRSPAPANESGRYGAQWWLYGADPRIPDDTFSTAGARGQLCTVVPSKDLVVVRTGIDPRDGKWDQIGFVAAIIAALPQ